MSIVKKTNRFHHWKTENVFFNTNYKEKTVTALPAHCLNLLHLANFPKNHYKNFGVFSLLSRTKSIGKTKKYNSARYVGIAHISRSEYTAVGNSGIIKYKLKKVQ